VEPPDIRRFVKHLEVRGLARGTVVKVLAPVKAMYATAREDGQLRANPTDAVRVNGSGSDGEEERLAKAMTCEQLGSLLASTPDEWRLFFELLAHSGLRIAEVLGLDWSDVVFGQRPRLQVRRQFCRGELKRLKTRQSRRDIPLSPRMARRLWAARPATAEGPMFKTRNGTRYADRNVRRVLDRAKSDELSWVGFHSFRHTCASMLFAGGKNIRQVAEWLGHADPAFTLRTYVHLLDDGLGGADLFDEAVQVGNAGATHHPKTAANGTTTAAREIAV
jgi:integrase